MARFLKFHTGARLLFVGEPSALPISFRPKDTIGRDPSRLNRIITNHIDTEQEYQQVLNLAQSYNLPAQPIAGKRAAHNAVVNLVSAGRIVAIEVDDLSNEQPLNAATAQNVANMDMTAKAARVYDLLPRHMKQEAWEELQTLLDPTTIAIALGLLILAFTSGIGAAIMIGVGWVFLGWSVFEAVDSMWKFVNRFSSAESDRDLDECARLLADAIAKISVGVFVKILTKGAGKVAKTKGFSGKTSGGAGSSQPKTSRSRNTQSSGGNNTRPAKRPADPKTTENAPPTKKPKKPKSKREQYVGRTPGKKSRTGREVIERMRAEKPPRIRGTGDKTKFKASNGKWYPLKEADMAHKTDAVSYWNKTGRKNGAKSKEVRKWMLDSKNYELDHYSLNRSAGAKLGQTYKPPLK